MIELFLYQLVKGLPKHDTNKSIWKLDLIMLI